MPAFSSGFRVFEAGAVQMLGIVSGGAEAVERDGLVERLRVLRQQSVATIPARILADEGIVTYI